MFLRQMYKSKQESESEKSLQEKKNTVSFSSESDRRSRSNIRKNKLLKKSIDT